MELIMAMGCWNLELLGDMPPARSHAGAGEGERRAHQTKWPASLTLNCLSYSRATMRDAICGLESGRLAVVGAVEESATEMNST